MKKSILLLFSFLTIISCSKEEEETQNILGKWNVEETTIFHTNQVFTSEVTISFEMDFKENGEGISDRIISSFEEFHWVVDELENKAFIIRAFIFQNGEEVYSTQKFDIEKNTTSEQIWKRKISYSNSASGDLEERFITWTLTK
ncbi:MAG: hypothetical protein AB8F94_21455 [Saprospiraceae bacterium]